MGFLNHYCNHKLFIFIIIKSRYKVKLEVFILNANGTSYRETWIIMMTEQFEPV